MKYTQKDIDAYNERAIEEEGYEFESWLKLQQLRHGRNVEIYHKQIKGKYKDNIKPLQVKDRVTFYVTKNKNDEVVFIRGLWYESKNKVSLIGYITAINTKTVTVQVGEREFTMAPKYVYPKLSFHKTDIEIPEELKNVSTKRLLQMRDSSFSGWSPTHMGTEFTMDQVYAELANRPHVPNKKEKKFFGSFKK